MSPQKRAADFSSAEIDSLFLPLNRYRHLALAVSGGSDSMALMLLATQWKGPVRFSVLTVDHGLRPESGGEARQVERWAKELGLAAHRLRWREPKPQTGVQARAREARYRLMARWCARHDAQGVVTAHTLDDQAETLLMRLARGSGIDGLSAMAAETIVHGVRVLRPLLGVRHDRLKGFVVAKGHGFFEDPSNANRAFERIRIRQAGQRLRELGMTAEALALAARRLQRAREALERAAAEAEEHCVAFQPEGHAVVALARFLAAAEEIRIRLLARLVERIGGASQPPQLGEIERLAEWVAASGGQGRTLGGCRVQKRGKELIIGREWGRMSHAPVAIRPGETLIWDDRFSIRLERESGQNLEILPLGGAKDRARVKKPRELPDFVFKTLPALMRGGEVVLVPQIGYRGPGSSRVRAEVLPAPHVS